MTTLPPEPSWTTPDTPLTPAHHAVEMEDLPRLRELLDAGADVDDPNAQGMTLLHHAVDVEGDGALQGNRPAHVDVTAFLLLRGANPEAKDDGGATPLDLAREYGHWLAVELLMAWQARRPD
ncbi:ankyrin repeat domain-containing protein [Actinoplanes sp. NEAU-A12]|uniref:Ankyrin repeat domain-containing protein n=1 Tax=Actinoplanes sandaracinus TaxID=3045177 RepID=A0ABT6X0S0_9ACTN|nr:ankyrin repeat domain-containing protein [Actinoplanes sandaracinus]MDI6105598.1 ankyrin repeat domain-containing protein [Actinoplanes sandaracinus]